MELTGVLADRYEIAHEIGRGGMATVYLAHDLRHDSTVAVKVLHAELAAFLGHARFDREIQVTARLQHPNILPIFDSGRVGELPYYVTPYIEGESLADRLQQEQQLPLKDALDITREIADALAYAHDRGVVHRDVKPANILLTHGHAVVSDFGIAHIAGASRDARLTDSGIALGTVSYMSPEQASGGTVDGRSDIYGLGCVLYEMLAGQPPFSGANPQAVIARHMVDPPPPIRVVRPSVSRALEAVVHKALAKSPADRFATAAEFRDAIRRVQDGGVDEPVQRHDARSSVARLIRLGSIGAGTIAILALLIFEGPRYARSLRGITGSPGTAAIANSIALLYFDDESPKHDMGYLASGLTDELIHQLSMIPALHVISRNGVLPYRDHTVSLDSIASALHVETIVTGTVQRAGDEVRVDATLVDAKTGDELASRTIEHPLTDLFALEDDVSQQVATLLRTRLGREIRIRQIQQGTSSVPAREMMLRAGDARDEAATIMTDGRAGTGNDAMSFLENADSLLDQAETADPHWVLPVIEHGWVLWSMGRMLPEQAALRRFQIAREYADSAVLRAPHDAEALALRGTVAWELAKDAVDATDSTNASRYELAAEHDLRAAIAIEPSLANAWGSLSAVLRIEGKVAEANVAARRALTEDAYLEDAPAILEALYTSEELLGDYAMAADACDQGRRRFPGNWRFVQCRLTLMSVEPATPDPAKAWALVARLDSMDPPLAATSTADSYDPIFRRMVAALISARAGQRDSALAVTAWARRATANDPSNRIDLDYDEANVRLALGEPDAALRLLAEYTTARPALKSYIARDPHFAALRNNPRFATQFTTMLRTPSR